VSGERLHRLWIQPILFLLTIYTTAAAGSRMARNFDEGLPAFRLEHDLFVFFSVWNDPTELVRGLPYALTLLAILLAHEFGHWGACRWYRLDATLPYFLPVPGFVGTCGAFLRIRDIIYSRRELFDIAVAGPLAGFALILPALYFGYSWSKVVPGVVQKGDLIFGLPLAFRYVEQLTFPGVSSGDVCLHPVLWAAWAGAITTAANLLPIGQLDGGHILYAWFPQRHEMLSKVAIALLVPLGFVFWPWFVWATVLYFFGRRHPYIHDYAPLDPVRKALALVAFVVFVISFIAAPATPAF
jgi:membrane-associated protease RseP (regulator of RpoE activity)